MPRKRVSIPSDFGLVEARFFAQVEGVTPLLMHSASALTQVSDETKRSGKKQQPLPAEEAERGAYRLPGGDLYVPAPAIRGAIIGAGKHFADPAYKRGTLEKPLAAALTPSEDVGVILMRKKRPITSYEVDVRRVVNPTTKGAIMCARAMIALPWTLNIEMGFDVGVISPELLLKVILFAGQKVGLLAFRPAKTGPYGRFTCTSFEVEV